MFSQRVEDNAFHLAAVGYRWIGFSEDDVTLTAEGANIRWPCICLANALRTTRSTLQR
jgi:hypothetical protein